MTMPVMAMPSPSPMELPQMTLPSEAFTYMKRRVDLGGPVSEADSQAVERTKG